MDNNNDGFEFVSYKKGKKGRRSRGHGVHLKSTLSTNQSIRQHVSKLDKSKILILQNSLEKSDFFIDFKEKFNSILQLLRPIPAEIDVCKQFGSLSVSKHDEFTDLICYGLGPFADCKIASCQLAFFLALKEHLGAKCASVYDPIFTTEENMCLQELGIDVLSVNERAKRPVNHKTVFFMPHCDLPLYNNLLWSNWVPERIVNVIVFGNSFSTYKRIPDSILKIRGGYVKLAEKFTTEVKISVQYEHTDVFNDMTIHYFKKESVAEMPGGTWLYVKEPVYDGEDAINYG